MNPPILKVAVATQNGQGIDLHFGHADTFSIYELRSDGAQFIETRAVEKYCQDSDGHEDRRALIVRVLADCKALFVARAGDGPKEKLAAVGIEPVDTYAYEAIVPSLLDWYGKRA
ncbi:MAG: dinitrogenase iron-molybdenum cofactor biosynthesis protein [Azoarcus sp.]|jgi:nitrogen fixation protein NifB|nr:dinitrogenase iron-molybdenum cofactor biosynthesis protein [Azoarcus sp.]